jgi:hypothetical protein
MEIDEPTLPLNSESRYQIQNVWIHVSIFLIDIQPGDELFETPDSYSETDLDYSSQPTTFSDPLCRISSSTLTKTTSSHPV